MTVEQMNEKLLLDYRAEIAGMEAENEQRKVKGEAMAFVYDHFITVQQNYQTQLNRF